MTAPFVISTKIVKVKYLFGMNNQLTLPRTEKLFYFKNHFFIVD